MNLFVWKFIYFSGLSTVESLVAGNAPLVVQLTDDNAIDTCQLRQTIAHFNTVMGSEWWNRINPQLSLVIMNRDDISSSFSHGMAVSGMSEFFTITCNGATSKSMAVLVWNQLDMIDPRHGVSFQLHRYEYPSTLYTQQQPVPQLRLIRESLNQSRNNLSAILKEKFELNVASMQLPSDRQRIGPILVEAKVLYAAEKCQRSIGDRLTVNSGNSRDEYYIYCLIMIFMTMVSLIITTRCYIMEIMNENVQTASQGDDDDDLVLRYPDNFDEYGQQKLHESLQTLGAHIRRRLHGQLLETEPEEVAGVTFDIYNQPRPSTAPEHQCNVRKSSKMSMSSQQQQSRRTSTSTSTDAMARALQPGGVPHRRQRLAKKAKIITLQRFTE